MHVILFCEYFHYFCDDALELVSFVSAFIMGLIYKFSLLIINVRNVVVWIVINGTVTIAFLW